MKILAEFDKLKKYFVGKKILIAVSGGVDSLSLLIAFDEWNRQNDYNIDFSAITVDHKLRPTSTEEAKYVGEICKKLSIKHSIKTWDEKEKPHSNLELIAREKRYQLIKEEYIKNNCDYLLVAHHLDDQAENFFIRLFRGSGIDGLSCMSLETKLYDMNILRPFLNIHKSDLINYLTDKKIKWCEDESNSDEKYLRNKIRNFLNSFENKNIISDRISFAIGEIVKSKEFMDEEFEDKKQKILSFNNFGSCLLNFEKLKNINRSIALKILSFSAMKISGNIYKPRLEKLKRLFETIINLQQQDTFKQTFYGCIFEKINDNLIMVYREYKAIGEDKILKYNEEIVWDDRFIIKLLKDIENVKATHIKEGEFNRVLEQYKKQDLTKFRELKNIKGIQKNIFYTMPVLLVNNEYNLYSDLAMIINL